MPHHSAQERLRCHFENSRASGTGAVIAWQAGPPAHPSSWQPADDFIVSNDRVALLIAPISEKPYLSAVFDTLFSDQETEVCIRPVGKYAGTEVEMFFHSLIEAAGIYKISVEYHCIHCYRLLLRHPCKGETAIGNPSSAVAMAHARPFGVVANPVNS